MKKIAITGLSGTIGTRLLINLPDDFEIYDLYHKNMAQSKNVIHKQIDLLDQTNIINALDKIRPDTIVHMASITHIDRCEEDRKNGQEGEVWKINVCSSDIISKYCKKNGTDLIFLSTECVFNGKEQDYDERAVKNPKNWYGKSKSEAEDVIRTNLSDSAIIRAVIAYHEQDLKKTLFGKILQNLKNKKSFGVVTDQLITPTYTDDIVRAINLLIKNPQFGIFHISSEEKTTIFDFAHKIANKFGLDETCIIGQTLVEYFGEKRAKLRLKNACLNGTWTKSQLGFAPLTLDQALNKINL